MQTANLELAEGFCIAAVVILGCRLVINLRKAYHLPFEYECNDDSGLTTEIISIHSIGSDRITVGSCYDERSNCDKSPHTTHRRLPSLDWPSS